MVALVGVIATALSLILFIVFCVTYTFKAKKCCFKHKGPAFERDTNFRIYPNDHYIVSFFFNIQNSLILLHTIQGLRLRGSEGALVPPWNLGVQKRTEREIDNLLPIAIPESKF